MTFFEVHGEIMANPAETIGKILALPFEIPMAIGQTIFEGGQAFGLPPFEETAAKMKMALQQFAPENVLKEFPMPFQGGEIVGTEKSFGPHRNIRTSIY